MLESNQPFHQSGTCYLVAEDVALSGSMAPDPEATSYRLCKCAVMGKADTNFIQFYWKGGFSLSRRIAEEDFDVTNINSWSPSLAHYTHVYNNINNNNENQEESSSNSRSMVKLLHRSRINFRLRSDDIDCCKVLSRSRHQWILGTLQTIQRIQTPPSDGPIMLAITSKIVVVEVFVVRQSWQYELIW